MSAAEGNTSAPFRILYQDEHYLAIHKPPKILVHLTRISEDRDSVVRQLRKQLGEDVSPVHRLDRATSGVLLFARSKEAASALMGRFDGLDIRKEYLAIVRGFVEEAGTIDHPVKRENGNRIDAVTDYAPLGKVVVPIPIRPYPQSRYSLVRILPRTGRYRQIRQHFQHIRRPIIGDRKHGDINHNRMFREQMGIDEMFLLARRLEFPHPFQEKKVVIRSTPEPAMQSIIEKFGWAELLPQE